MTTLATRLAQLSGLPVGAHTMAQHLRAIVTRFGLSVPASATVAAILIAYSGLHAGQYTVAEHLAVERSPTATDTPHTIGHITPKRRVRRLPMPLPSEAFGEEDEDLALQLLRMH